MTSGSSDEDNNALEYLIRRYTFLEHSFGIQWQALSAAGVRFTNPTYEYKDRKFTSAKELQTALDRQAVNLNISVWDAALLDNKNRKGVTDTDPTMENLRRDACSRLYSMTRGKDRRTQSSKNNFEVMVESSTATTAPSDRRLRSDRSKSTTAALHSSDLYLKKRKRTMKDNSKSKSDDGAKSLPLAPSIQVCNECMENFDTSYSISIERQYKRDKFAAWKLSLATAHYNLLLYGHGSKQWLLEDFCSSTLSDCCILKIKGSQPDCSLAQVHGLLELHGFLENDNEMQTGGAQKVLVIHNIDILLQQEKDASASLNMLVDSLGSSVYLICSCNGVDLPVIVNPRSQRRFLYIPVHTHRPVELTESKEAVAARDTGVLQNRSRSRLWAVLPNLAPRYAEVLQVLARLLLAAENKSRPWILYKTFFSACRDACLVDKDGKLRGLLQELKDHGLLEMRVDAGADSVSIPFDSGTLMEIVEYAPRQGR